MLIFIQTLLSFLISVECLCISKLVNLVYLGLKDITSSVKLLLTLVDCIFSIFQIDVIFLTPCLNFLFQLGCCLFLDEFFCKLTNWLEIKLQIEQESWNDWGYVVKLVFFVLKIIVLKVFTVRLRLPFREELLGAFPLVHHLYSVIKFNK